MNYLYDAPPMLRFACILTIAFTAVACDQQSAEPAAGPPEPPPPSAWKNQSHGWQLALPHEHDAADLTAAIEQARSTADEARKAWLSSDSQRANWAVKWAAPLQSENASDNDHGHFAVEHLWVQPLHWSPFRIEGILLSEPLGSLAGGGTSGDLVSFPIEELSDWVHFHTGDAAGKRTGGFTIDALESRYGKPPTTP